MSKPLSLLLVEDDAEDALLFQRRCPPNTQLTHVDNVVTALDRLRQGGVDICFTDFRLGAASGLELIRRARSEGLRTPMVVITGQEIDSLGENALLAGATDFVPKDDLDATVIERVSRWALIRRHVENRREDCLSEEALQQLLGRPSTPAVLDVTGGAEELRRVVYISQSRRAFSQLELLSLCAGFAAANARCQITGMLVLAGNCFFQIIEGKPEAIEVLLRRIQADPRHSDMSLLIDESVRRRSFGQWNMGCIHLNVRYELSAGRWQNVLSDLGTLLAASKDRYQDLTQVIRSLPQVLGRLSA